MTDRWLYIHAGAAHGPVDLEKLAQLAAQGKLLPTDRIWPAGEDMRRAVEAHTLLNAHSFRSVEGKVEATPASPPHPASASPDWLTDVEAFSVPAPSSASPSSPDAELVNETPDVQVVNEEPIPLVASPIVPPADSVKVSRPSSPAAPKPPVAAKRQAAPPSTRRPAPEEANAPDEDEDEAEEGGLGFKRRDLVMFGLGVIGVCLAVAAGLFFAKRSQRKTDEVPPQDDRGEGKP